ncbi:hypothetical protein K2173_025984 [Erythroxylum novogranatense]|uniref:Uncharacterized protein n=1 Tax=Erythroxylum novogranatense TaxID=1862640 RepID=A0AAV8SHR9_9ROSI|nr:hypothetical protein K2173_025984 [Erythroxylum novogranatense]
MNVWHSPTPYLFGSLALMLTLISTALIVLACSCLKRAANSRSRDQEKTVKSGSNTVVDDGEPKVLVVMAGDSNPTHLAISVTSSISSNT